MLVKFDMTIENKLMKEKRDINVYHNSTRSAHIISYNNSVTLPLRTIKEGDYLLISVVSAPGNLMHNCWINMPSWLDFKLDSDGMFTLNHSSHKLLLTFPPGPPVWQLKVTLPVVSFPGWIRRCVWSHRYITIRDNSTGSNSTAPLFPL